MTDQEIFEGIARKDNKTFRYLYQNYQGKILGMVQQNNGNEADALDIFQEGLVALWTNINQGKFTVQQQAKVSTYLYTLCRNIWISRLRKKKPTLSIDNNPTMDVADEVNDFEERYERIKSLEQQFEKLGDTCKKLLKLFYYKKASLKAIAEAMDITEKTAKNNKYRCMQSLRANFKKP